MRPGWRCTSTQSICAQGGTIILIFIVLGAWAATSFCILLAMPGYMVVPPDNTVFFIEVLENVDIKCDGSRLQQAPQSSAKWPSTLILHCFFLNHHSKYHKLHVTESPLLSPMPPHFSLGEGPVLA